MSWLCLTLLWTPPCGAREEVAIDSLLWEISANNGAEKGIQAADGDIHTRWDNGGPQQAGQWFQIDLGERRSLSRVEVDAQESANDYPRKFALAVSSDGKTWEAVAEGDGEAFLIIEIKPSRICRYLRLSIPDGSPSTGNFWSIHEIRAFGEKGDGVLGLPRPALQWRLITPKYPTREKIVAGYNIIDFGIDPRKGEDATHAIRLATRLLSRAGGGTLWLPEGRYRLSEPLVLSGNVTLRGEWIAPEPGKPIGGTVLEMTAGQGDAEGPPGISLYGGSAVNGLVFWYPEQSATQIVPFPATIKQFGGGGMALENVTFVNAYRGFACGPEGCALYFMRNVFGTVLETGIKIDGTSDIGRIERVRFSPDYWTGSGLPNAPIAKAGQRGPHAIWMAENGNGIVMRRNDWSYAYDVTLEGYRNGFYALPSLEAESVAKGQKNYPNGQNARMRFVNCRTAIRAENVADVGMMFHDIDIVGAEEGIVAEPTFKGVLQIQNSRIAATQAAARLLGPGQILFTSCVIEGKLENPSGYIGAVGCLPDVKPASGQAAGIGEIRAWPASPDAIKWSDPYRTPTERYAPPTDYLAVVTDSYFGAKGDTKADDTEPVRKAIAEAAARGGGTVFFPAGEYRITGELNVPTGVELRGVSECPHNSSSMGSIIDVAAERGNENASPFITLATGSGVRGLTFHYPVQDAARVVPYPWTIRGNGAGIWLINLTTTLAYRYVDLATKRCDDHYVDYVAGHALREGIRVGGGSKGGRVLNGQFNASYYTFTNQYANSPNRLGAAGKAANDGAYDYAKANADTFIVGDCTNEILFQNFVFGARHGLVLTGDSTGPSGWCLGHGSDQCRWGVSVERIGAAGLPLVNTQLVTVTSFGGQRGYIALEPGFTGTLHCLGIDAWGGPSQAFRVAGGKLEANSVVVVQNGAATLALGNLGRASLSNAVLHDVEALVERSGKENEAELSGILITRPNRVTVATTADMGERWEALRIPGSEAGVSFPASASLPRTEWKMHSKLNASEGPLAVDGDPETRWCTGRSARSGDEVIVEMDRIHTLSKIRLDTVRSGGDYPRRLKIYLSKDGRDWGEPIYAGSGSADFCVGFTPRAAKAIRIVNLSDMGGFWSIHEIEAAE